MEKFESDKFQHQLNSEFRRVEEFLHEFESVFAGELQKIIFKTYSNIELNEKIHEAVLAYANEIINVAESVCDKDMNYTELRLKEELDNMARVVENYPPENLDCEFLQKSHQNAKKLIVDFYPYIFDLSANGFRLLEKYCQMYNWKFVDIFQTQNTSKQ